MSIKILNTTFVCIRHGESEANVFLHANPHLFMRYDEETNNLLKSVGDDPNLSERGVKQAEATANHLEDAIKEAIEKTTVLLYVSPLKRAQQTLKEFKRHSLQPLFHKKEIEIKEMQEYEPKLHGNAENFVEQVFALFEYLCGVATNQSIKNARTVFLFGHSLVFSTLMFIMSTHQPFQETSIHLNHVKKQLCDEKKPKFLICKYHLPNCSVSVAQSKQCGETEEVEFSILGTGKDCHLQSRSLSTGGHTKF